MQSNSRMSQPLLQGGRVVSLLLVFALVLSGCDLFGGSNQPNTGTNNQTNVAQNTPGRSNPTMSGSPATPASGSPATPATTGNSANPTTGSGGITAATNTSAPPTDTPAATISVKVNNAWDGSAVVGATVAVQQPSGPLSGATDGSGGYSFDKLDAAASVTVSADGYAAAQNVKLNPGANTVSLIPNTIHGKVTDATSGKPLANVLVRAYPSDAVPDPAPVQATPTVTSSYNYGGKPFAAPAMSAIADTTPTNTIVTTSTTDLGYVRVFGTDTDGLWLAASPKHGADHVRLLPEGTILKVTGADIPDTDSAWVPVQTTDAKADSGYAARIYVAPSAAPGAPTFTPPPPPPPSPTPTPPPPATLLQQPITTSNLITFTDANGNYILRDLPPNSVLHFKDSGYELTKVPTQHEMVKDVALKQFHVHALYYTAEWAASSDLLNNSLKFVDSKDVNAIVLNIQDNGSIALVYTSSIPLAKEVGHAAYFDDLPAFVKMLQQQHHLYVIARIVCFVEPGLVNNRPDLAVKSSATGKPIVGGLGQEWLDPTNPDSVKHILSIIDEVKSMGFDEVQMDYMRFLSDTSASQGDPIFKAGNGNNMPWQTKAQYVESFLSKAYELTRYTDTFLDGDVFGYILWPDQPEGPINRNIGQIWEYVISHLDYVSPMIYPSHFSPGEQGFSLPNDHPYEIIHQSGVYAMQRLTKTGDNPAKYRPWLQYFTMNGNLTYTGDVVRLETKAAADTGTWGWMMWDASNNYVYPNAFDPKK